MDTEIKNKIPEYLELLPDGNIKVKTKEGEFILQEPNGEAFDSVERIAKGLSHITDFKKAVMLVSRSLKEPKGLNESDLLNKYKISTLKRIAEGMNLFLEENTDFL